MNDPSSVALLKESEPDVCLVFGTAILGDETLQATGRYVLNIHGGITPNYRNVHSEFWAVLRRDVDNVGVTVMHLTEGIDSGAIALQCRLPVDPAESIFSVRHRNRQLAVDAGLEVFATAALGSLPAEPQNHTKQGFYSTPGLVDLVRLWVRPTKMRDAKG